MAYNRNCPYAQNNKKMREKNVANKERKKKWAHTCAQIKNYHDERDGMKTNEDERRVAQRDTKKNHSIKDEDT